MNPLRTQSIERATSETQDVLVVGAGINGAVSAAALAGRGVKVTVIDRADFASGTSQESSNLAWGGIKYLETYEFGLVWNLCKSRNRLMEAYPTQVREIRFFTSIARGFRKPVWMIRIGAWIYWLMGRCSTRPPRSLPADRIRREAPMVQTDGLAGGLEYSDAWLVENDARFTFGFIRKVLRRGGNAVNYMELTAAEWKHGMWHARLTDRTNGDPVEIRARCLINAAGPQVDRINGLLGIESRFRHVFSKGVHIIVPRISDEERILTFFASDGRLFFMIPMADRTCIGTTDTRTDQTAPEPNDDDVRFLLDNANALLTLDRPLTRDDVIATRCGVRPLAVRQEDEVKKIEWTALSRKHEIDLHPERNCCSIYGGKLTDCINIGDEIAEHISSFGIALFPSLKPWYGEPDVEQHNRFATAAEPLGLPPEEQERLWRRYGRDAFRLLELLHDDAMREVILPPYTRAELQLMAELEMIVEPDDFLRRRTRLALTVKPVELHAHPGFEAALRLFSKYPPDNAWHHESQVFNEKN